MTHLCFADERRRARVWEETGTARKPGVLVGFETEYERAIGEGIEPMCERFPREAVIEVWGRSAEDNA